MDALPRLVACGEEVRVVPARLRGFRSDPLGRYRLPVAQGADRRKAEETRDTKAAILEAAEACFEQFGIAKTTMEDVARAARVSRGTLYNYYQDRDSLIVESVARRARQNFKPAREYIAQWDRFEDRILEGISQNIARGVHDPLVNRLVSPAEMTLANSLLTSTGAAKELTTELWAPILQDAQAAGDLRKDIDIALLCEWISQLEMMCINEINGGTGSLESFKVKLRQFFIPALMP
jgi:AcrR family transcriptional regulator